MKTFSLACTVAALCIFVGVGLRVDWVHGLVYSMLPGAIGFGYIPFRNHETQQAPPPKGNTTIAQRTIRSRTDQ